MSQTFLINLWGDLALRHPLSRNDQCGFQGLRQLLQAADFSIANFECSIQDGEDWPAAGLLHLDSPPWVVNELRSIGFGAVYTANNKACDFGEGGMLTTIDYLDRGGIAHTGTGRSLSEASAPAYVTTRIGRLAILSAADNGVHGRGSSPTSIIPSGYMATDEGTFYRSRPGLNLLRFETTYHVDEATIAALKRASRLLGWEAEEQATRWRASTASEASATDGAVEGLCQFHGGTFIRGDEFKLSTAAHEEDLDRNCKWIRHARATAELVIVGVHQNGAVWRTDGTSGADNPPADHIVTFAHAAVEAGADIVQIHGAGKGGVEILRWWANRVRHGSLKSSPRVSHYSLGREFPLGLPLSATPADVSDYMIAGRKAASQLTAIPQPKTMSLSGAVPLPLGGRDMFHTVLVDDDLQIRSVHVRPIAVKRGGPNGAGTPQILDSENQLHGQVVDCLEGACRPLGSQVDLVDGVAVVSPSS